MTGQARERQRLRHRLGVLELVLDDHPHDEAPLEQRIAVVERQLREEREHGFADVRRRTRVRLRGDRIGSPPRSLRA